MALCFAIAKLQAASRGEVEVKTVLVLYGERGDLPAIRAVEENLRQVFHSSISPKIEVMPEYCDFARFPPEQHGANLVAYLRQRYRGRKIDLIMPVAGFALEFILRNRSELFPNTPIVFCATDQAEVQRVHLPADATGVVGHFDFEGTFSLIQRLQPDALEILIIHGKAGFDLRWAEQARQIVEKSPSLRARTRWFGDGTLEQALEESRRLSPKSAVMYLSMLEDASGRTMSGLDVARDLARESAAPVYGLSSHWLPAGILGGALYDFGANGRQTAELALQVLRGEWVPYNADRARSRTPVLVNWTAMRKWRIPESRLPPDAEVRFREPTQWEQHRVTFIGIVSVIMMQSALIGRLLWNRARRRRTERELRESEERMSLATKAADLGLWVWDIQHDSIWSTDKGRELFGFNGTEPLSFALINERLHPDDRMPVRTAVETAIANGGDYYNEHRVLWGTAPMRWIAVRGRVEFTPDHRPLRMLGVSIDITSRKQAESELQERRGELAHLSRVTMLGELSGSLAHELNQPLTAILSNAQAAQRNLDIESPDLAEVREILADIVEEDERAGEVIRRLRLLFKKGEVQQQTLDANELVLEVLKLMRSDLANHGVTVETALAPDLGSVCGDRVQLQQVLLNLMKNSCDAMAENQPGHRRLTLRTVAAGASGLRIEVSDTGHGFPDGDSERVFERYYTTKSNGLGLGLSVCRTIIGAHGGTLTAANNLKQGATFVCTLGSSPVA